MSGRERHPWCRQLGPPKSRCEALPSNRGEAKEVPQTAGAEGKRLRRSSGYGFGLLPSQFRNNRKSKKEALLSRRDVWTKVCPDIHHDASLTVESSARLPKP